MTFSPTEALFLPFAIFAFMGLCMFVIGWYIFRERPTPSVPPKTPARGHVAKLARVATHDDAKLAAREAAELKKHRLAEREAN